jgi:hypothetical protein
MRPVKIPGISGSNSHRYCPHHLPYRATGSGDAALAPILAGHLLSRGKSGCPCDTSATHIILGPYGGRLLAMSASVHPAVGSARPEQTTAERRGLRWRGLCYASAGFARWRPPKDGHKAARYAGQADGDRDDGRRLPNRVGRRVG